MLDLKRIRGVFMNLSNNYSGIKSVMDNFVDNDKINFSQLHLYKRRLQRIKRIVLIGNGEAYSSALAGAYIIEGLTDYIVNSYSSFEFLNSKTVVDNEMLLIAISEFGDDVDTILSIKRASAMGARVIAVCGDENSDVANLADGLILQNDFSFSTAYLSVLLLALFIGEKLGTIAPLYKCITLKMAELLTGKMFSASKTNFKLLAELDGVDSLITCGTGVDYALAYELSRNLAELGINTTTYYPSELPVNIENKIILATISNKDNLKGVFSYLLNAVQNGAKLVIFTTDNIAEMLNGYNVVAFNDLVSTLNPLVILEGLISSFCREEMDLVACK